MVGEEVVNYLEHVKKCNNFPKFPFVSYTQDQ